MGAWDGIPAKVDFGAFYPLNLTSGGNNFNDFPANQLLNFSRLVWRRHNKFQIGMVAPYLPYIPLPAPLGVDEESE